MEFSITPVFIKRTVIQSRRFYIYFFGIIFTLPVGVLIGMVSAAVLHNDMLSDNFFLPFIMSGCLYLIVLSTYFDVLKKAICAQNINSLTTMLK